MSTSGPHLINPKQIKIGEIGDIISSLDLQIQMNQHNAIARPLFEMKKPSGDKWSVIMIDGLGLAIVSHQTQQAFLIEAKMLVLLACEAGVEDQPATIIIPAGVEVDRG